MQLFLLFIDSNTLHVSGVTRPSSGVQETVYAAYGTFMLFYVTIDNTILSMGPWLMSYNRMWLFMVVGYSISFHWLVFSSFFVIRCFSSWLFLGGVVCWFLV